MRDNEAKPHRNRKGPHPFLWWAYRYRLSANNGKRKHRVANDFHGYDRRTRVDEYNLAGTEFTYRIAISIASAGTFAVGIGQCLTALIR